jgi:hypothetical protein
MLQWTTCHFGIIRTGRFLSGVDQCVIVDFFTTSNLSIYTDFFFMSIIHQPDNEESVDACSTCHKIPVIDNVDKSQLKSISKIF